MNLDQLSSAILNELWAGTSVPLSERSLISKEQIEDEILAERLLIIREWYLRGTLTKGELAFSINCIPTSCEDINNCPCKSVPGKLIAHFEIPQLVDGLGSNALIFVGSTDKSVSYKVYYNREAAEYHSYKKRNSDKPYVYIEKTPNKNGMYDGWLFNAPFVKYISVIGIFKDPRQLENFGCCDSTEYLDMGSLSSELIRRILAKKVSLYRVNLPQSPQVTS